MHGGVRRTGLALDVDEQLEDAVVAAVDPATLPPGAISERVEVERLQRAGRVDVLAVVRDEQLALDQPDVGLDTGESVRQGVLQRAVVLVVVVGVGLRQRVHPWIRVARRGGRGWGGRRRSEGEEGDGEEGREQCAGGPRHDVNPTCSGRTPGDRTHASRRTWENSRQSWNGVTIAAWRRPGAALTSARATRPSWGLRAGPEGRRLRSKSPGRTEAASKASPSTALLCLLLGCPRCWRPELPPFAELSASKNSSDRSAGRLHPAMVITTPAATALSQHRPRPCTPS